MNRPEATWCESCRKGLTLGGRMAEPWGKSGIASRISTAWAILAGAGCLMTFVFAPVGLFLLLTAVFAQVVMGKSIRGVCPHCRQDTATTLQRGALQSFPCVHCGKMIVIDRSPEKPVFVKAPGNGPGEEGDGMEKEAAGEETSAAAAGSSPPSGTKGGSPALLALWLMLLGFGLPFLADLLPVQSWLASRREVGKTASRPAPPPARAGTSEERPGERILAFHSDIDVMPDGSMRVRETIRVRAEGQRIRRGIYRDFPTRYHWQGRRYDVGFGVAAVERDGRPEPWHQVRRGNGVRVYIGEKNRYLSRGVYTYALTYRTDRQLGLFEDHDELYWNVTGNGWEFPIDNASCTVTLPPGVPPDAMGLTGYTGPQGSTERAVETSIGGGAALFRATRPLGAQEGLTVGVTWPKGYVTGPSLWSRLLFFAADNRRMAPGMIGVAILLVFYLVSWVRVGRDPSGGVVVPLYVPPRKLSAAATRYVRKMGFDNKVFTAAIIEMASRGYLAVREEGDALVLEVQPDADPEVLTARQRSVARKLFPAGEGSLELKNTNHRYVGGAIKALRESLAREHLAAAFHDNRAYFGWGILITVAAVAAMILRSEGLRGQGVGIAIWLSIWTAAAVFLWVQRVWIMAVIWTVSDILVAVLVVGEGSSAGTVVAFLGTLVALMAVNALFYHLLKAPTRAGRRLMDEIEGFRTYLAAAEGDRLRVMNPPERTPKLFERYLPYALALGVEQEWAEKFSGVLDRAATDPSSGGYRPSWYHGSRWSSGSLSSVAGGIGSSLTSAISSSSQPPGSRSGGGGGGGGGSSGGGGGGGGGGGW